jgi:hypothetical protein
LRLRSMSPKCVALHNSWCKAPLDIANWNLAGSLRPLRPPLCLFPWMVAAHLSVQVYK